MLMAISRGKLDINQAAARHRLKDDSSTIHTKNEELFWITIKHGEIYYTGLAESESFMATFDASPPLEESPPPVAELVGLPWWFSSG